MIAAVSVLQRWTVEDSGTTQHQIPVIPMVITAAYHWLVDWLAKLGSRHRSREINARNKNGRAVVRSRVFLLKPSVLPVVSWTTRAKTTLTPGGCGLFPRIYMPSEIFVDFLLACHVTRLTSYLFNRICSIYFNVLTTNKTRKHLYRRHRKRIHLDHHLCVVIRLFMDFRSKSMLFYVLDILFILFICIWPVFTDHLITPVTYFINTGRKLGYTKDTTYIFRCISNTSTIFVVHQEPVWTCSCPMVSYAALFRILVVIVLHFFLDYRVG